MLLQSGLSRVSMSMNKRYKGGVLPTALLFVFLFSFIFTFVLEDFQLTQRFTKKTKEYYIAKTMLSMFLADLKSEKRALVKKGQQNFSTGILRYEYNQPILDVTIHLNQTTYKFQEQYQEENKPNQTKSSN